MSLGSWLRDRPRLLERAYQFTEGLFARLRPLIERLGYVRADRVLRPFEEPAKRLVFDCRMCGQCVLHSTGMTCPKNLRNGPCGGVRPNGNCEVIPDMRCIWTEAYERSQQMTIYAGELLAIQPPVNHRLQGGSAWINMLTGADRAVPPGWAGLPTVAETRRQPAPADSGGADR